VISIGTKCISLLLLLCLGVTSCQSPQPIEREVTRVVPQTVVVTQIVNVIVTSTPLPLTPTPAASATPEFMKWSAADAVAALTAAGVEFADARPMTKDDYGLAPMTAAEGIRFMIPSLCEDCGGRLYSFADLKDLELMEAYYVELGRSSAILFSWVFTQDNILIQINGQLPEETARKYETAIKSLE
jgi:hypothetical protein